MGKRGEREWEVHVSGYGMSKSQELMAQRRRTVSGIIIVLYGDRW